MVDTIDGTEQIIMKSGTNSDTTVRLSRKGACKLGNKSYRGDHIVRLQVRTDSNEFYETMTANSNAIFKWFLLCRLNLQRRSRNGSARRYWNSPKTKTSPALSTTKKRVSSRKCRTSSVHDVRVIFLSHVIPPV